MVLLQVLVQGSELLISFGTVGTGESAVLQLQERLRRVDGCDWLPAGVAVGEEDLGQGVAVHLPLCTSWV